MTIIANLASGEAVKFNNSYLVQLPSDNFEVEGTPVTVSGYSGQQFTVNDIDNIYAISKTSPTVIGFKDNNGDPYGSVDEYKALVHQNNRGIAEGYGSIDAEFEIRRKLQRYNLCTKVMSEPEIVKTKQEIRLVGSLLDTGSRFITTAIQLGRKGFEGTGGAYKVYASNIASDEFAKIIEEFPNQFTNATHSNLKYAQFKSNYIFTRYEYEFAWIDKEKNYVFATLEEAKALEDKIRTTIRQICIMHAKPEPISDVVEEATIKELINILDSALSNSQQVSASTKTRSSHTTANAKIREAITKLRTSVKT